MAAAPCKSGLVSFDTKVKKIFLASPRVSHGTACTGTDPGPGRSPGALPCRCAGWRRSHACLPRNARGSGDLRHPPPCSPAGRCSLPAPTFPILTLPPPRPRVHLTPLGNLKLYTCENLLFIFLLVFFFFLRNKKLGVGKWAGSCQKQAAKHLGAISLPWQSIRMAAGGGKEGEAGPAQCPG